MQRGDLTTPGSTHAHHPPRRSWAGLGRATLSVADDDDEDDDDEDDDDDPPAPAPPRPEELLPPPPPPLLPPPPLPPLLISFALLRPLLGLSDDGPSGTGTCTGAGCSWRLDFSCVCAVARAGGGAIFLCVTTLSLVQGLRYLALGLLGTGRCVALDGTLRLATDDGSPRDTFFPASRSSWVAQVPSKCLNGL